MKEQTFCPITKATELLAKKWVILIMYKLLNGPMRFSELESEMAISGRLLSDRLKELEAEEIVTRKLYPEIPPRVEYELTPKGKAIKPIMDEIGTWVNDWSK